MRGNGLFYSDPDAPEFRSHDLFTLRVIGADADNHGDWTIKTSQTWCYVNFVDPFPDQGWKLHLSATMANAQRILSVVEDAALRHKFSFKYLKSKQALRATLGKYSDRSQCGKFIAIYPADDRAFERIVADLSPQLRSCSSPEVLTDVRIGDTPLHARYGAFRLFYCTDRQGRRVPAIRDVQGRLIPDLREPRLVVPEGFDVPTSVQSAMQIRESMRIDDLLPGYQFQRAMHFSNAGGVYLATRGTEDKRVVVKQARPWVGIDDTDRYATERLKHEYGALRSLQDVDAVVSPVDLVEGYGHVFLVEEFCDGVSLSSWIARNYPYSIAIAPNSYLKRAHRIITQLKRAIEECHMQGWALLDIQPMNVMVDQFDNIKLIDLESAVQISSSSNRSMGTPGFVPEVSCSLEDQDWYAFDTILVNLLVPLVPLNSITPTLIESQIERAKDLFGNLGDRSLGLITRKVDFASTRKVYLYGGGEKTTSGELRTALSDSIHRCLSTHPEDPEIPGDILSFEQFGKLSIGYGLGGVADYLSAPMRENFLGKLRALSSKPDVMRGYLHGIDGAQSVAVQISDTFDVQRTHYDPSISTDISLRTGLSGIILSDIAKILKGGSSSTAVVDLADRLAEIVVNGSNFESRYATSPQGGLGLLDGELGAAVALNSVAKFTGKGRYRDLAFQALEAEMRRLARAEDGSVQLLDRNRLMPYIAEGSAGFLISAALCPDFADVIFDRFSPSDFVSATKVRAAVNGGLHYGMAGLLLARHIASSSGWVKEDFTVEKFVEEIKMYCFSTPLDGGTSGAVFLGGQGGLRLSADLATGNAGVLRAMDVICDNSTIWRIFPGLEQLRTLFE